MSTQSTTQSEDTAETTHEKRLLFIYHPNITFIPRPILPEQESEEEQERES